MDTDLFFGTGLSLFRHQRLRGCVYHFWRLISVTYLPACAHARHLEILVETLTRNLPRKPADNS